MARGHLTCHSVYIRHSLQAIHMKAKAGWALFKTVLIVNRKQPVCILQTHFII